MKTRKRDLNTTAYLTEDECSYLAYLLQGVVKASLSERDKAEARGDFLERDLKEWQSELCAYVALALFRITEGSSELTIINVGGDD